MPIPPAASYISGSSHQRSITSPSTLVRTILTHDCPLQVEAVLAQADQLLAQFSALRARHQQVSLYCTVLYCTVL